MTNLNWIFYQEIPVPHDVQELLISGEVAEWVIKTVRDVAIFTNKRLIVKDVQGLTGSKVEIYSLPNSSVNMWSIENAGMLDFTSEVELWTRAGNIKIHWREILIFAPLNVYSLNIFCKIICRGWMLSTVFLLKKRKRFLREFVSRFEEAHYIRKSFYLFKKWYNNWNNYEFKTKIKNLLKLEAKRLHLI